MTTERQILHLSVPFSSGQWLLLINATMTGQLYSRLSVPFSSGQWLLLTHAKADSIPFSPLFIAAMVATDTINDSVWTIGDSIDTQYHFQSPFHRGNGCYNNHDGTIGRFDLDMHDFQSAFHRGNGCYWQQTNDFAQLSNSFQSAFHRGNGCYQLQAAPVQAERLSVRFSSGQWLLPCKSLTCHVPSCS